MLSETLILGHSVTENH